MHLNMQVSRYQRHDAHSLLWVCFVSLFFFFVQFCVKLSVTIWYASASCWVGWAALQGPVANATSSGFLSVPASTSSGASDVIERVAGGHLGDQVLLPQQRVGKQSECASCRKRPWVIDDGCIVQPVPLFVVLFPIYARIHRIRPHSSPLPEKTQRNKALDLF